MKHILVVDDAATLRMYHRQLLEEAGFKVDEAANGYEALEKAVAQPYDLLIVDINMPVMDGYTLLKNLRGEYNLASVPVIVISTEEEPRDAEYAYYNGANCYFVKPADPAALVLNARLLTGEI